MSNIEREIIDTNTETGEVLHRKFKLNSKNKSKEINSPFGDAVQDYKSNFRFVKQFTVVSPEFRSNNHRGYFYSLAPMLHYRVCGLGKIDKETGEFIPYSANKIMEFLGIKKGTFYQFRKECFDIGALARVKFMDKELYLINPAYMSNGGHVDYLTYIVFSGNKHFMDGISKETKAYIEADRQYAEIRFNTELLKD